jgi:hypothetical protein
MFARPKHWRNCPTLLSARAVPGDARALNQDHLNNPHNAHVFPRFATLFAANLRTFNVEIPPKARRPFAPSAPKGGIILSHALIDHLDPSRATT